MELIAGDIGGTHSRLAWVTGDGSARPERRFARDYPSRAFATADDLIRQFIGDAGAPADPDTLLLAVPGPVESQHVALTNLDWRLDAADMRASLGIAQVRFINDFQAAAAGVATLGAADVVALNAQPVEANGVRVVTGAGTGLGLAYLLPGADGRLRSHASEGGHADFAPADARQVRLLARLQAQYGHVSWERVASGMAMPDLYAFCADEQGAPPQAGSAPDGAVVSARAAAGDAVAEAALDLFAEIFAAWVGNVALLFQPRGGLYLAGGIAMHLQSRLRAPRFMAVAADKGRMRCVVERTPVFLVTNSRLGVEGAIASGWATH
ncbi:MAG: glucokinase [Gammaproteobacteria bacterium]